MKTYGSMNAHGVGIILKELVRRAIKAICAKQFCHEITIKKPLDKKKKVDFFSDGDTDAQKIYVKSLRECFPDFGIIGEENCLRIVCTSLPKEIYFVVDPLDGTKAFARYQSHGIGTMIALIIDGKIITAWVGDINTGEIYGYRPESDKVHRITEHLPAVALNINKSLFLGEQYVLLRKRESAHSVTAQRMIASPKDGGLFKDIEVTGGSIGIMMARLWKGEVGATILEPGIDTPWDCCPIVGISEKLGFKFLELKKGFPEYRSMTPLEITKRHCELLVIHESRLRELKNWS